MLTSNNWSVRAGEKSTIEATPGYSKYAVCVITLTALLWPTWLNIQIQHWTHSIDHQMMSGKNITSCCLQILLEKRVSQLYRTTTTTSLQTLSAYNSNHDRQRVTGVHLTGISCIPAPVIIYMHLKQDFSSTLRKDDAVEILIS